MPYPQRFKTEITLIVLRSKQPNFEDSSANMRFVETRRNLNIGEMGVQSSQLTGSRAGSANIAFLSFDKNFNLTDELCSASQCSTSTSQGDFIVGTKHFP